MDGEYNRFVDFKKAEKEAIANKRVDKSLNLMHLKAKWAPEIRIMKRHDKVTFDDYAHKGKLRGKHIAKAFHSDAKKLGLKTRLRFVKDKGVVEAV